MTDEKQLGIVIPAYKSRFLEIALDSIANQTDKRFKVYVVDDCSPENIKAICDRFINRLDLVYKRFGENLGKKSLTGHWNRCVRISIEPWVWLFCDDDVMESGCVKTFYKAIEIVENRYDVYRFNTLTIDAEGKITRINPPHPLIESGCHFGYHRLNRHRFSYISEYIFSRKVFDKASGMIEFPVAWCSDDASLIHFAGELGIFTLNGSKIYWRDSGLNLTTPSARYQHQKIEASIEYLDWLKQRFESAGTDDLWISDDVMLNCQKQWFYWQLRAVAPFGIKAFLKLSRYTHPAWNNNFFKKLFLLFWINIKFYCRKFVNIR